MAKDGYNLNRASLATMVLFILILDKVTSYRRMPCRAIELEADDKDQYLAYPPRYNSTYNSNDHVCWKIYAEHYDECVRIKFIYFMLETSNGCKHDSLSVYDGDDSYAKLLGKFCGNDIPDEIVSKHDVLYLEFVSDSSLEYNGFKLAYSEYEDDYDSHGDNDGDDNDKDYKKDKKHSLTTLIVGGIIGGLVLMTGSIVFICVCTSSRRCSCRPGSGNGSVNPDNQNDERSSRQNRYRRPLGRTDRVSPRSSLEAPPENLTGFPFDLMLPTYSEQYSPPPYNGHELQNMPSSSPPPYSPNDPNPFFIRLNEL